jgi:hypothetical protein
MSGNNCSPAFQTRGQKKSNKIPIHGKFYRDLENPSVGKEKTPGVVM